ncbi:MAG TPA: glutathione S-transferase [Kiloniellales bacterium]|jgi:glutathione S-transferase
MKLRYSSTSPYVRKVTVSAIELGLAERIERIPTNTSDPKSGLVNDNPLGKVPALSPDDGEVLYDSPVICEYLDSLHTGAKLFPAAGPARWRALRQQALCDGILDAAILRMLEVKRRPEALRWPDWIALHGGKMKRAIDRLEAEAADLKGPLTIGQIAVGCTLGYLDFRYADEDWRPAHPKLAAWYKDFAQRPSMLATIPKDPA